MLNRLVYIFCGGLQEDMTILLESLLEFTRLFKKGSRAMSKSLADLNAQIAALSTVENSLLEVFGTLSAELPILAANVAELAAKVDPDLSAQVDALAAHATKLSELSTAVAAAVASVKAIDDVADGEEAPAPEPAPEAPIE